VCEEVVYHIALFRLCTQPLTHEVQQRGGFCGCIQVLGVECFCFVYEGGVAAGAIPRWSSVSAGTRDPDAVRGCARGHCRELGAGDHSRCVRPAVCER
jgi:hypothetical protein